VEQQLTAGLGKGQIAKLIEDDEVPPGEIFGNPSLAAAPRLGLEPVDEIDSVVEAAMFAGANATAGDRYGEMRLADAGPTDQDTVALLGGKIALSEITHQALIDRRAFELKAVEVLCQGELGDSDLIFDRACLFFARLT
jgi:hypothetical protein